MMGDKQVEEYLGVLEPLLSHVVVTENSWRDRVMPAEDLKTVAERVFGAERVTCVPELPDAIQELLIWLTPMMSLVLAMVTVC